MVLPGAFRGVFLALRSRCARPRRRSAREGGEARVAVERPGGGADGAGGPERAEGGEDSGGADASS